VLDHLYLPVTDLGRSRDFYETLLGVLGAGRPFVHGEAVGFGVGAPGAFWLSPADGADLDEVHVAFRASTRQQVHEFHAAAVKLGAEVLHEPRLFPGYHPSYFAVFVRDPDGHNVEAVCHT
jgi:catechol 2,3-dioxygenase-like lactoylglutathione lyase family enzyme